MHELTQAYQQACDFAFQKVSTGAQDYISAVREATANLAKKGIRTIDYESGVHTSLEAAVRRNIMGGMGIMQEQISQHNHDFLGCNGWEISAHAASAPDHEPIQGKQYTDEEYTQLNNSLVRRIGMLHCGHYAFGVILGVHSPQYTPEELEQMRRENEEGFTYEGKHYTMFEATQRQRNLERAAKDRKRRILIDEQLGDKDKLQNDQIRLQMIKQEYSRFSKAAGLPTQHARMEAAGFTFKDGKAAERHHSIAEYIGTSVGAKAKNYQILNPQTGGFVQLVEGTRITQPKNHIMAGQGRERQIDCIDWLIDKYGGDAVQWTKEKGFGFVADDFGEARMVELHWYQEPTVGKVEMKIKERDGRIYIDDE